MGWTIETSNDNPDSWKLSSPDVDAKETVDPTELDLPPEEITVLVEEVQD